MDSLKLMLLFGARHAGVGGKRVCIYSSSPLRLLLYILTIYHLHSNGECRVGDRTNKNTWGFLLLLVHPFITAYVSLSKKINSRRRMRVVLPLFFSSTSVRERTEADLCCFTIFFHSPGSIINDEWLFHTFIRWWCKDYNRKLSWPVQGFSHDIHQDVFLFSNINTSCVWDVTLPFVLLLPRPKEKKKRKRAYKRMNGVRRR